MRTALLAPLLLAGCTVHVGGGCTRIHLEGEYRPPPETLTCSIPSGGLLEVLTRNGSVEIRGGDVGGVEVIAERVIRAETDEEAEALSDRVPVRLTETPGGARVALEVPAELAERVEAAASLRILAPRSVRVQVVTSNGPIRAEDLAGPAVLETSNGNLEVRGVGGAVEAQTSNGAVRVADVTGPVSLETSNGGVTVERCGPPVEVRTSNGAVVLSGVRGEVVARSSNASITCGLPAGGSFVLDARTSNARVHSEFEEGLQEREERNVLRMTVGGGGPLVRLETSNGAIHVRRE